MTEIEFHDKKKPRTIVSFTGIGHGMGAIQQTEFFRLTQQDFNVLFVKDPSRSWYNNLDVASIRSCLDGQSVATIGNSMGAFHAAMFAMDYPVDVAICFAAQYSIHPDVVPTDRRYRKYAKAIAEWKYDRLQLNTSTQYHFISGDARKEVMHLNLIPDQPNIHKQIISKAGHKVARKLKEQNQLYSMIGNILSSVSPDGELRTAA